MRAMIVCALLLTGCGANVTRENSRNPEAPAVGMADSGFKLPGRPADEVKTQVGSGTPPAGQAVERKIIYTAVLDLVVEDFTPTPAAVDALVKRHDGFIAGSKVSGAAGASRHGEWTLRIPAVQFEAFLTDAEGQLGEVRSVERDSDDVSADYYDVEARIKNKRQEESRLLKLLEEKTGSLEDVLQIEKELSRVREEIERHEGRLRVLADLTTLTTVTLRVQEIKHYVPETATTFGARVSRSFSGSLEALKSTGEALIVAGAGLAPWATVLAIPAAIALRIWSKRRRTVRML